MRAVVDWRQCAAVMQREAVIVMPNCSGGMEQRGPFEKFMDSLYYSELELCAGALTVSFLKYLP
jgi:hypothetical protein